jgi:hypothetical protein
MTGAPTTIQRCDKPAPHPHNHSSTSHVKSKSLGLPLHTRGERRACVPWSACAATAQTATRSTAPPTWRLSRPAPTSPRRFRPCAPGCGRTAGAQRAGALPGLEWRLRALNTPLPPLSPIITHSRPNPLSRPLARQVLLHGGPGGAHPHRRERPRPCVLLGCSTTRAHVRPRIAHGLPAARCRFDSHPVFLPRVLLRRRPRARCPSSWAAPRAAATS